MSNPAVSTSHLPGSVPSVALRAGATNLTARFELNGVPVLVDTDATAARTQMIANEWVRRGENQITATLAWPRDLSYAPNIASALMSVEVHSATPHAPGAPAAPAQEVARLSWPRPNIQEAYPQTLREQFSLPDFPPTRLWNEASLLPQLTAAERAAATDLTRSIHDAYQRRDVKRVLSLLARRTEDVALAFGETLSSREESVAELTTDLLNAHGWALEPLDPDALEMELVAEGRLIWVTGPGYAPAISSVRMKQFQWSMHLYAGILNRQWWILR